MEKSNNFGGEPSIHSKVTNEADTSPYNQDKERQFDPSATEEKTPNDSNIVDWDGPDDPTNPMNWSSSKKVVAIGIVSLITMLS